MSRERNFVAPAAGWVLLAEDDELFGDVLRQKLTHKNIKCDWFHDLPSAKEALKNENYHAALIDMYLKSDTPVGLELVKVAKENGIPAIIITSRLDLEVAKVGLNNGADYVIEKPFEAEDVERVLQDIWETPRGLISRRERYLDGHQLTNKEKELARLILKGLTNQEIAEASGTTLATVKYYTNQIFEKCEVTSRAELFNTIFPT